jgi:hypothetical protein
VSPENKHFCSADFGFLSWTTVETLTVQSLLGGFG